jgi:multiple RNA-binding domain-containing protein 1
MLPEHAVKAYTDSDHAIFQGRVMHILPAKENPAQKDPSASSVRSAGSSYKTKKQSQLKEQSSDEKTWNSLFMSSDAVADAMANKLNVKKGDLLNPEGDNTAVKLALAETHIIQETKKYLEKVLLSVHHSMT